TWKGRGLRRGFASGMVSEAGTKGKAKRFAASVVCGAGVAVFSFAPQPRGAERREARGVCEAPFWQTGATGPPGTLARRSGTLAIGTLASRRSTAAFFEPGPRFPGHCQLPARRHQDGAVFPTIVALSISAHQF